MQLYTSKMIVAGISTNNSMDEIRFEYFNASNGSIVLLIKKSGTFVDHTLKRD